MPSFYQRIFERKAHSLAGPEDSGGGLKPLAWRRAVMFGQTASSSITPPRLGHRQLGPGLLHLRCPLPLPRAFLVSTSAMDRSRAHFAIDASGMPGLLLFRSSASCPKNANQVPLVFQSFVGKRFYDERAPAGRPFARASKRALRRLWSWGGDIGVSRDQTSASDTPTTSATPTTEVARFLEANPLRSLTTCSLGFVCKT